MSFMKTRIPEPSTILELIQTILYTLLVYRIHQKGYMWQKQNPFDAL